MGSGSKAVGREGRPSQVSTCRGGGGRAGLVKARALTASAWRRVLGFAILLTGFCASLVLGVGRNIDVPMRVSFRLNHPHNWPAWLYIGSLQATVLVLVAHLVVKRCRVAGNPDGSAETHIPAAARVCFLLVGFVLMAIGEVAIRSAIAGGW